MMIVNNYYKIAWKIKKEESCVKMKENVCYKTQKVMDNENSEIM